jgi:hypothetical protein
MGCGWLTLRPGLFNPVKETRYSLYRGLGVPQGWAEWMRKISLSQGFDSRTVQPETSLYTD